MAIDTATKRRAALGRSVLVLPPADGSIDKDDRAILLRLYLPYASTFPSVVTPFARIYPINQSVRVVSIQEEP